MKFDTVQIRAQIVNASAEAIEKFCEDHSESEICAFALYSDSDGGSIGPAFNTRSNLQKNQEREPDDKDAYKWTPAEWSHEGFGDSFFETVSQELFQLSSQYGDAQGSNYRGAIFELCVSALEQLRPKYLSEAIYLFSVTDFRSMEKEVSWIRRINTPVEADEFENWIVSCQE